ncbi:hypothetical protein DFA_10947 [Cavenderia fasciculata]|uniref:Perilipin n=1 Tax=Cavenderia fasciculata TaxID=261658 RepID=F4QBV1_CACFS|nr:uncharacterized protein DFA_10947 [Cavenderia fasciculata]EGG14689.1 hypothetical protein DFA_10947 [Cavenderia fasciculata]|eukprot:XP_004351197.1 hypothetical protein DFA_10947 [Cavenderia fasciculata]
MSSSSSSNPSPSSAPSDVVTVGKYATLSRIYDYSLVQGTVDRTFNLYNYAKQYSLLKTPIALTEQVVTTIGKPILDKCDPLLQSVDQFGVKKLDQIESTVSRASEGTKDTFYNAVSSVDGVLDRVLDYGSEKIQGTQVNDLVQKTVGIADSVVDTVLPPPTNEDLDNETEMYHLEKRCKLFLKLRKRINKESLMNVPSNSYNHVVQISKTKPLSATVDLLMETAQKLQDMTFSVSLKGASLQSAIDNVYKGLNTLSASVGSFTIWVSRFDTTEVYASLEELSKMVRASKDDVANMVDENEKVKKLKNDTVEVFRHVAHILQQQIDNGLAKYEDLKKPDSMFKNSIYMLESAAQSIITVAKEFVPSIRLNSAPTSSSSTATSSSSTPAQESGSSPSTPPIEKENQQGITFERYIQEVQISKTNPPLSTIIDQTNNVCTKISLKDPPDLMQLVSFWTTIKDREEANLSSYKSLECYKGLVVSRFDVRLFNI